MTDRMPEKCRHCQVVEAAPRIETLGPYRGFVVHDYERGPTVPCDADRPNLRAATDFRREDA